MACNDMFLELLAWKDGTAVKDLVGWILFRMKKALAHSKNAQIQK